MPRIVWHPLEIIACRMLQMSNICFCFYKCVCPLIVLNWEHLYLESDLSTQYIEILAERQWSV